MDNSAHKQASEEQVAEKTTLLENCQQELDETKQRLLYLTAEFDNFKKRTTKEQALWAEQAQDKVLLDLLSVTDDLERALSEVANLPDEAASYFNGFQLILKNLISLQKKYEIEELSVAKEFDPELCEAVMQQESPDHQSGEIVAVLQKGYLRKGRVLRVARVIVAQ